MAVDVGSTTIAAHLCNLATGEVVASSGAMNPQIRFGEDLMSRVSYVMMNPGGEKEMTAAIRQALVEQHMPSALQTHTLHAAEAWRTRLLADDDALGQWINLSPRTDNQQLRALVRQARKDAQPEKRGAAPRHSSTRIA